MAEKKSSKSANAAVNIFTDVALTGVSAWGGPAATAINSTAGQFIKPAVTTANKAHRRKRGSRRNRIQRRSGS